MDHNAILKQMLDFNKTAFDNTFKGLIVVQDQSEKLARSMMDQASWLPPEGKKAIENWLDTYKTGREKFKTTIDDSFEKVESYFSGK